MKRRRRFVDGECNHIYQRTVNGFNIFYDLEDYLVFYMILSTSARKFNVRILKICLMVDHIHILLEAESCKEMADFVRYYSSVFVREFNDSIGREGQLMYKSFGSAPKKAARRQGRQSFISGTIRWRRRYVPVQRNIAGISSRIWIIKTRFRRICRFVTAGEF